MKAILFFSFFGLLAITTKASVEIDFGAFEMPIEVRVATENILKDRCPSLFNNKYVTSMPPVEVREVNVKRIENDQYQYSLTFLDEDYYLVDEPFWAISVDIGYDKSRQTVLDSKLSVSGHESKNKICK